MNADDRTDENQGFAHLIRATIAIVLTLALPVVLYTRTHTEPDINQVYLDALAAVVSFYFGASAAANPAPGAG